MGEETLGKARGTNRDMIQSLSKMTSRSGSSTATAFPNAGGDYHFLRRAYGKRLSFLFAWARFSVITTGSIMPRASKRSSSMLTTR